MILKLTENNTKSLLTASVQANTTIATTALANISSRWPTLKGRKTNTWPLPAFDRKRNTKEPAPTYAHTQSLKRTGTRQHDTLAAAHTHLTLPPQYWHWEPCHPSWHRHEPFRHTPLMHSTSLHLSAEQYATDTQTDASTSSEATSVAVDRFRRYLDLNRNRNMSTEGFMRRSSVRAAPAEIHTDVCPVSADVLRFL